ncbi:MAG: hypothetical protein RRB13_13150 [bacterium]|nr:hypothetical protein [bacterium]
MDMQKLKEKLVRSGSYTGMALLFAVLSACSPVSDIYLNYDGTKPKSEVCTLRTQGTHSIRTDVDRKYGMKLIAVDGQLMRDSQLIRVGETTPRYISENDPYFVQGGERHYLVTVVEARLTPGKHDFEVANFTGGSGPLPGQIAIDHIKFLNWNCKAGVTYQVFYSNDEVFGHLREYKYWIEDENRVLWEGWKRLSVQNVTYDLSKIKAP